MVDDRVVHQGLAVDGDERRSAALQLGVVESRASWPMDGADRILLGLSPIALTHGLPVEGRDLVGMLLTRVTT